MVLQFQIANRFVDLFFISAVYLFYLTKKINIKKRKFFFIPSLDFLVFPVNPDLGILFMPGSEKCILLVSVNLNSGLSLLKHTSD